MTDHFRVSVVIPVYNAEKFVARAVTSALDQPEVAEVIVIDDGYKDGALEICKQLALQYSNVKLLQHPNGCNLGAGASRNLGILYSSSEYIAFLDADDYFLPERFAYTKRTFAENSSIDVVYEPVVTEMLTEHARAQYTKIPRRKCDHVEGEYISYPIVPLTGKKMFESFILNNNDAPHTNGITIKKSLFAIAGLFNSSLRLHQDTELWVRLSYQGYFAPTENHTKPVAVRTMHDENRVYHKTLTSKLLYYRALLTWATQVKLEKDLMAVLISCHEKLLKALTNQDQANL